MYHLFGDARFATPMVPKQIVAQVLPPNVLLDPTTNRQIGFGPSRFGTLFVPSSGSVFTIDQPAAETSGILQKEPRWDPNRDIDVCLDEHPDC